MENKDLLEWEKEFRRVRFNIIYFLEKFYNTTYPDKAIELTDGEKQKYYDKYKGVPFIGDMNNLSKYMEKIEELKKKGYKDWEILR